MKHLILTICAFMMLSVLCPDAMAKSKKGATAKKKESTAAKKITYDGPMVKDMKDHEVTLKGVFHVDLSGNFLFQPDETEKIEGRSLRGIAISKGKLESCKNLPEGDPRDWNKKAMKIHARIAMQYGNGSVGIMKIKGIKEFNSLELIEKEKPAKEE